MRKRNVILLIPKFRFETHNQCAKIHNSNIVTIFIIAYKACLLLNLFSDLFLFAYRWHVPVPSFHLRKSADQFASKRTPL